MSRSPFFFVERFNKYTNKYELQHPKVWNYNHTKEELADLYPYNGNHELFSIVEETGYFPKMQGIHLGLPNDVSEKIKTEFEKCQEDDFTAVRARWFTYADMYIYFLKNPSITVNEDEDENKNETNPIQSLMDRVNCFLEVMDEWDWEDDYSLIRIVYWIY